MTGTTEGIWWLNMERLSGCRVHPEPLGIAKARIWKIDVKDGRSGT